MLGKIPTGFSNSRIANLFYLLFHTDITKWTTVGLVGVMGMGVIAAKWTHLAEDAEDLSTRSGSVVSGSSPMRC